MEEIELNSQQWRQLAKQLDNESRRTESFPVQKRLRRQADDALRRAVAMETEASLAKGDVSGHEFHGNQWSSFGSGGGKFSAQAKGAVETKVGPGKATLADAQANGLVKDNGNGTHSWSSILTTDRADGRADTKSGRGTASSKGEAQQAAHDWAKGQGFSTNLGRKS